jgi:hypothetical protein
MVNLSREVVPSGGEQAPLFLLASFCREMAKNLTVGSKGRIL